MVKRHLEVNFWGFKGKMLNFNEFFSACTGSWTTERIYYYILSGQIERSYTEYTVTALSWEQKQQILSMSGLSGIKVNLEQIADNEKDCPGFAIAFETNSETGEQVSMSLKALFIPDALVISSDGVNFPIIPVSAEVSPSEEVIQGFYLRDEGYSEAGAIASRFTYLPTRQTLEMTTYYRRSVAIDQMRIVAPDLRIRTIINYQRPENSEPPSVINLVGFGPEKKQSK